MSKNIHLNGPVNVIRLEGKVNNINKVLYLFMDVHVNPQNQTECKDIRSIDVRDYFVQTFDKLTSSDKYYDFFVEDFPTALHRTHPYKDIYLEQIRKLLRKGMNLSDGIVKRSTQFPNVRFHYLDIRDYTQIFHETMKHLQSYVVTIRRGDRLYKHDFDTIMDATVVLAGHSDFLFNIFFKNDKASIKKNKSIIPSTAKELASRTIDDDSLITKQIIKKMLSKYEHKNIQKAIIDFMNKYLKKYFNGFFKAVGKLAEYLKSHYKYVTHNNNELVYDKNNVLDPYMWGYSAITFENMMNDIFNMFMVMKDYWWQYQTCIMDIYFLRRFLDKDYVTNAIVYTGAAHSHNYIYFLVKHFNFKITNYSYMKGKPADNIKKIHKMDNPMDLKDMFYPKILEQCSNVTGFPMLFK